MVGNMETHKMSPEEVIEGWKGGALPYTTWAEQWANWIGLPHDPEGHEGDFFFNFYWDRNDRVAPCTRRSRLACWTVAEYMPDEFAAWLAYKRLTG